MDNRKLQQRPDRELLGRLLRCVDCHSKLPAPNANGSVVCTTCSSAYPGFRNRPVLMRQDNSLFPRSDYQVKPNGSSEKAVRHGIGARIKSLAPGRSVNLARDRMFARIVHDHGKMARTILVLGCGDQANSVLDFFRELPAIFVFCDVDKGADVDLFCDSHALPFSDISFDGVITTAVFEHVASPDQVAGEIHRVLAPDGFVYSELPFLQAVHEGAYDFTRFTLSGHRMLFRHFQEIEAGLVAGPGTALVWAITEFAKALSGNKRISSILGLIARFAFFWFKYFDLWMARNAQSADAASCTFFYGTNCRVPQDDATIVAKYRSTGSAG